jgi:hypothetical protein
VLNPFRWNALYSCILAQSRMWVLYLQPFMSEPPKRFEDWPKLYPYLSRRTNDKGPGSSLKRAMDIVGSVLALIVLFPIFVVIAIAIKRPVRLLTQCIVHLLYSVIGFMQAIDTQTSSELEQIIPSYLSLTCHSSSPNISAQ